jgi:hypothetical protein
MQPVSEFQLVLHQVMRVSHLNKVHCFHYDYQLPTQMHQHCNSHRVHLPDLDNLKPPEAPADFKSLCRTSIICKQMSGMYVAWI